MSSFLDRTKGYLTRVIRADATKRGVAGAGAGLIMAMVIEALWPSPHV